jgi:hypothetical protein
MVYDKYQYNMNSESKTHCKLQLLKGYKEEVEFETDFKRTF